MNQSSDDNRKVLRNKADEFLNKEPSVIKKMSTDDIESVLHELHVHQIELEMQNEELRRAQIETAEIQNKYIGLYDFAPIGYIVLNKKNLITEANLTICSMLGLERYLLLNTYFSMYISKESYNAFYLSMSKVNDSKFEKITLEVKLLKKNKNEFHARLECVPEVDLDGHITGTLVAIIDIDKSIELEIEASKLRDQVRKTEKLKRINEVKLSDKTLRESEKRFRSIFENAGVGAAILVSSTGQYVKVNKKYADFLGYTIEDMEKLSFQDITHPEDIQFNRDFIDTILIGKATVLSMNKRYIHKNGSVVWGRLTISPLWNQGEPKINHIAIVEDITERKKAEEQIANLAKFPEENTNPVFRVSKEGVLLYANSIAKKFLLEDLTKVGDKVSDKWVKIIKETYSSGKKTTKEIESNGKIFLSEQVSIVKSGYINIYATDITELKKTFAALAESEQSFRTISESVPDSVIMMDNDGKIIYWNKSSVETFGYSKEEVIGKVLHSFLVPERYHKQHEQNFPKFQRTGHGAAVGNILELAALRKNGDEFPIELSVSAVKFQNKWHSIGIIRDITYRKRTEEKLKKRTFELGERVKELNCLYTISELIQKREISLKGGFQKIVDCLPQAWQYPDITCARLSILNKEHKTSNFIKTEWTLCSDIVLKEKKIGFLEVAYLEKRSTLEEGPFLKEERWLINSVCKILSNFIERANIEDELSTTYVQMNKYAEDLKISYKMEKKKSLELKQKSLELERSNDELENFAYVASHDLKAPLRAIDNLASWIAEDLVGIMNDETKDHIAILKTRVSRMENLLNSLLAYSRVGRIESKVEKTDLNKLLSDIIAMINPPESVSIDIPSVMPVFDALKAPLQQVFMNLIGNAIKHRDKQNINIVVSFEDIGEFYRFIVKDDGPGIPEKLQGKAFQLFQTLKPRDEVEGSGMGLAIIKKTIESQGGTITLNSTQGTGASFSFTWNKKIK